MSEFNANLEMARSIDRFALSSDDIHDRRTEEELVEAVKRKFGVTVPATFKGPSC